MSINMFKEKISQLAAGIFLAAWAQISVADGWVSGRITAMSHETKVIGIDDRTFTLSPAALSGISDPSRVLQPGQAVRFEADGKLIKRIEVVKLPPN